jgi:hypothetical protein
MTSCRAWWMRRSSTRNVGRKVIPHTSEPNARFWLRISIGTATFEAKCAGVPSERLSERGVPPSSLSLHGLVRHLAGVERWWFRIQFAGEDVPLLYYSDDDPNQDFDRLDGGVSEAFAAWRDEMPAFPRNRGRRVVAGPDRHHAERPDRLASPGHGEHDRRIRPAQRAHGPAA